jgi:hypothetical protein
VRRRIVPLFISLLLGAITSLACSEPAPACPTALSWPDAGDPGIVVSEPADDAAYLFDQGALRTYNLIVAEADLAIIDANPMTEQWVTGMLEFEDKQYGPLGIRYKGSVGAFLAPCMGGTPV